MIYKGMNVMTYKRKGQISESAALAVLLTLTGGFLDAYTFISRGGVFANAQTGNIVLLGVNIAKGSFVSALYYLIPVLAFAGGVLVVDKIQWHFKGLQKIHWRQIIVMMEIFLLALVSLMPHSLNMLANITVSFVCALQVDSFRKVRGNAYATTMCTGNLRSGTAALAVYMHTKDEKALHKVFHYYGIILVFIIGAAFGAVITGQLGEKAVLFACLMLFLGFLMMFIKEEIEDDSINHRGR